MHMKHCKEILDKVECEWYYQLLCFILLVLKQATDYRKNQSRPITSRYSYPWVNKTGECQTGKVHCEMKYRRRQIAGATVKRYSCNGPCRRPIAYLPQSETMDRSLFLPVRKADFTHMSVPTHLSSGHSICYRPNHGVVSDCEVISCVLTRG